MRKMELVIMAGLMALSLSACGGKKAVKPEETTTQNTQQTETTKEIQTTTENGNYNDGQKENSDIKLSDIENAIVQAIGEENYLCDVEKDKTMLVAHLELDESKIIDYIAKENSINSVHMDQLMVFKVVDGYAQTLVDKINSDFEQTVGYIRQYPFGVSKVLNARLYESGDYVVFVIAGAEYDGEDSEKEDKLAKDEYAKIDKAIEGVFGTLPENLLVVPED